MTREDDVLTGAWDQFAYDALNRLQSALVTSPSYGDQLQEFTYDAFGNRISSTIQRVTGWSGTRGASTAYVTTSPLLSDPNRHVVNATFNASATAPKNQIPATTSTGVATGAIYDAQGNLTQIYATPGNSSTQLSMIYDALGRVIQVGNSKTNRVEKYQYTADGLRVLIEVYSGTTFQSTIVNLHDDAHQLVSQYEKIASGSLTWKRDITYLGSREAAEFDSAGMHVTQVDRIGSPRVMTGPTGALESTQKYLPFGELLEQHNYISGAITTAKGFTNHEQTDPSGLIYMQARFYAPWCGRFTSPDPGRDQHFEETQSWNIYSYVRNNPVMSVDPTGMEREADKDKASPSKPRSASESMEANGSNPGFAAPPKPAAQTGEVGTKNAPTAVEKTPFTIAYSPYLLDSDTKSALQGLGANPGVSVSEIKTQADLNSLAKNTQGDVLLMGHASDGHFYGAKGQPLKVPSDWAASAVALAGCKTSALASQLQQHGNSGTKFYLYPDRLPMGLLTTQLQSTNPRSFGYYGLSGLITAWNSGAGRTYPAQELHRTDGGLQLRNISVMTRQWMEVGQ